MGSYSVLLLPSPQTTVLLVLPHEGQRTGFEEAFSRVSLTSAAADLKTLSVPGVMAYRRQRFLGRVRLAVSTVSATKVL